MGRPRAEKDRHGEVGKRGMRQTGGRREKERERDRERVSERE